MTPPAYKSERTTRALSQAALAAMVGVHRVTIAKREAGTPGWPITKEAWLAICSLPARVAAQSTPLIKRPLTKRP